MEIVTIPFEESFQIKIENDVIEIILFKTTEDHNVKFGINAPRAVKIHREEIYNILKEKEEK